MKWYLTVVWVCIFQTLVMSRLFYLVDHLCIFFGETPFKFFFNFLFCIGVKMKVLVAQLCLTLCDPMDCIPPDSSVHGILQARILEWIAILFSRGSSWSRDQTKISCIVGRFFTIWATREAQYSQLTMVSGEQWRDSAIHIYTSILSQTSFPSRLPHIMQDSVPHNVQAFTSLSFCVWFC